MMYALKTSKNINRWEHFNKYVLFKKKHLCNKFLFSKYQFDIAKWTILQWELNQITKTIIIVAAQDVSNVFSPTRLWRYVEGSGLMNGTRLVGNKYVQGGYNINLQEVVLFR